MSFREVDAEYGSPTDTADTGACRALAGVDGVKRSQSFVDVIALSVIASDGVPTTMPSSLKAVNDCSCRLLASMHRKIESFGEYAAPRDSG